MRFHAPLVSATLIFALVACSDDAEDSGPACLDGALGCPCRADDSCEGDLRCDGTVCRLPPTPDGGRDPDVPSCELYCSTVMANCAQLLQLFDDEASCLAACATWPTDAVEPDEPQPEVGNSMQCRLRHAQLAADDAAMHCGAAAADGGGICGSACDHYCNLMLANCEGAYDTSLACLEACADFPAEGDTGNSVGCRVNAASDDPARCGDAGPRGGGECRCGTDPEPNNTRESGAAIGDCGANDMLIGGIEGEDVDWFNVAAGEAGCSQTPRLSVQGTDLRLCALSRCASRDGDLCAEGEETGGDDGRPMCCAEGGAVSINLACADSLDLSVRVSRNAPALTCEEYTLSWEL